MEEQGKPLSRWRFDLQSSKKVWVAFYREFLGVPPSSIPRLYKALNQYGFWPLFEAVVASSEKDFAGGDPMNYVIKVAANKWRESEEELQQDESYTADLEAAKEKSKKANDELAKKLNRISKTPS